MKLERRAHDLRPNNGHVILDESKEQRYAFNHLEVYAETRLFRSVILGQTGRLVIRPIRGELVIASKVLSDLHVLLFAL